MNADLKKPNKERLLTTLRGGIADRVPNYEILIEPYSIGVWDARAGTGRGASTH